MGITPSHMAGKMNGLILDGIQLSIILSTALFSQPTSKMTCQLAQFFDQPETQIFQKHYQIKKLDTRLGTSN
jgi:hypothetical protein